MRRCAVVLVLVVAAMSVASLAAPSAWATHATGSGTEPSHDPNINWTQGPDHICYASQDCANGGFLVGNPHASVVALGDGNYAGSFKWWLTNDTGSCQPPIHFQVRPRFSDQTWGNWYTVWTANSTAQCWPGNQHSWIFNSIGAVPNGGSAVFWGFRYINDGAVRTYGTGDTEVPPAVPRKPLITSSSTAPAGKVLSYDMVAALALDAGWGSQAATATAVAQAESSFRTKAISYIGCCHGLWQVNTEVHPYTPEQMYDPYQNATAAKGIYDSAGSWQPWEAYTGPDGSGSDGPFRSYLAAAQDAVARQERCGNCALGDIASAPSSGNASVTFAWSIGGSGAELPDGYHVDRRRVGGSWSRIGAPGASALRFVDNNATAGTTFEYRVRGHNVNGTGEWSDVMTITSAAADPSGGNQLPGDTNGDGIGDSPHGGGAADPDGDGTVSCGWNMFCWIKAALKWAFVPGEGTKNAWNNFYATVTERPPGSWAVSGFQIVTTVHETLNQDLDSGKTNSIVSDACGSSRFSLPQTCVSDLVDTMANQWFVEVIRGALSVLVYGGLVFALWRRSRNAVGDKVSEEDSEGGLA